LERGTGVKDVDLVFSVSDSGPEFRLEIRSHGTPLTLTCIERGVETVVSELGPLTLRLLQHLVTNPGAVLTHKDLRRALWGEDHEGGDIGRHVSFLRVALRDTQKPRRFIARHFRSGYEFLCTPKVIQRPPNHNPAKTARTISASPRLHEKWNKHVFLDVLDEVQNGDGAAKQEGDLRIVSSLFHDVMDLGLQELLLNGKHIKILVMNPKNIGLIRARYSRHRKDFGNYPERKALKDLKEQIGQLSRLPGDLRAETGDCRGSIEVRVSNIMPCGFLVLSRTRDG
jgi:DNA-binding winged helix-turn-helix (wHTH) protein